MSLPRLPELKAGIYRHYKAPLYQVFGYAHDANSLDIVEFDNGAKLIPDQQRIVVVYMSLQLDQAHTGPRLAVRTAEDFHAWVDPIDGKVFNPDNHPDFNGSMRWMHDHGFMPRFDWLGYSYHAEMTQ